MNRREWLRGAGMVAGAALHGGVAPAATGKEPAHSRPCALGLEEFQPKSMLKVNETHVPRSKFPVIDFHTHLSHSAKTVNGVAMVSARTYASPPAPLVAVMDRKNIRTMVNLTGGYGDGLRETVAKYDRAYPGRFVTFTEPCYPQIQADAIARAHQDGARGLKILKTLGLYLRENITTGKLVRVDDPRLDPMWEACGQLGMPVAIHVADPEAFFQPTDRFNERYEELSHHPDWSFYGRDFPSVAEILEARNRVLARHPKTSFVVLHVGNHAEDLADVAACLDRFPNMHVDLAARIGELGRQPRTARKFFDRYQDRIVLGTDATPLQ
jgi:predicted TIM-barrel fold metal-dependent hydrolase